MCYLATDNFITVLSKFLLLWHRPWIVWSNCSIPLMSLTLRKYLRVRMALLSLDLSRLWVITEKHIFDKLENYSSHYVFHPQDPNIRIYIVATYAVHARPLLCEVYSPMNKSANHLFSLLAFTLPSTTRWRISYPQAYHRGLRYPRHLLLTIAWYARNWWLVEEQNISCTAEQRESVLPTSLGFLHFDFLQDLNLTTDTGIVSSSLHALLHSTLHTLYIVKSVPYSAIRLYTLLLIVHCFGS